MANFFLDRPVFAWVLAIIVMLTGAISIMILPVAQYPSIAPPQIEIVANYPGASAQTVEDTVTQIIEQKMKGIDNLVYMSSTSDATGQANIRITFRPGTNPDIAQVQVQNKLQLAMPMLPEQVQRQGVRVNKSTMNFLLVIGFISNNDSMSQADISDYLYTNIFDPLSRVNGVGDVTIFGAQYAMRIWCDPDKFREYNLSPTDVVAAIRAQNDQIPGGQIGAAPFIDGQQINMTVIAATRLETIKQFEKIILRSTPSGAAVYLKDVARIELDGENYFSKARYNGKVAAALSVKLSTGANALATAEAVKKEIEMLSAFFPPGLEAVYPYDTTPFVKISIKGVFQTLGEAIFLVFLVMYLFLQDFRATLIPTIAVPIVLLGTFAVLAAAGFSINTLTMFAMVLAIGLLVDDAIVVVENVERLMREEGLSPKDAARKSMEQISSALIGIGMVLAAVFVPMAFFGGSTGVIYRQFSITIVSAMAFSVLVALILTPVLCASMLRPHVQQAQGGLFGWFNRWFDKTSLRYQKSVAVTLPKPMRYLMLYVLGIALMTLMFFRLPTSFFPEEDQGILFTMIQLPPAATFDDTVEVIKQVEHHFLENEKDVVDGMMAVAGFSFAGNGQNTAIAFVRLKDWDIRGTGKGHVQAIADRANRAFSQILKAQIFAVAPPAVMELANATGFDFQLLDRSGQGHDKLVAAGKQLIGMTYSRDKQLGLNDESPSMIVTRTRHNGQEDIPHLKLHIDKEQASAQNVSLAEINTAIAAFWGSFYVNDFIDRGRVKKVILQADAPFRMQESDFNRYYIRSLSGEMVPLANFLSTEYLMGSPRLERYNGVSSLQIQGEAVHGKSSGAAMDLMEHLATKLPEGFDYEWSSLSYQEKLSGAQAPALYALSILIVFLCLAALYESWSIPFSVMLIVPFGMLGALAGAMGRGLSNDVYFQVGLLAIIGLSAKNAILIVEFAKDLMAQGQNMYDATLHAARMRLRPIIMTSLAFILGVLPLALSNGAGSGGQNAIGTAVVCGTLVATIFGIFYTPVFFVVIHRFFGKKTSTALQAKKK